jgi:hypothetical protein
VHEQVWELRRELAELRQAFDASTAPGPVAIPSGEVPVESASSEGTPASDSPASVAAVPSKELAAEMARRFNPVSPKFWRRLGRVVRPSQ